MGGVKTSASSAEFPSGVVFVSRERSAKKPRFAKAPRAFVLLQNRRDVEVGKAPDTHLNVCFCYFELVY